MSELPLVANSLAEAYFYLMATTCEACGRGSLSGTNPQPNQDLRDTLCLTLTTTCSHCGREAEITFKLPHGTGTDAESGFAQVNPTDEASTILDVAQWLTLFRTITEAASRETDKQQARHLGIEAAQCLEEALKFYDEVDNDLPPPDALFSEASRERLREHPDQFSRQRLIGLRQKLPSLSAMRSRIKAGQGEPKKPWWRFGR